MSATGDAVVGRARWAVKSGTLEGMSEELPTAEPADEPPAPKPATPPALIEFMSSDWMAARPVVDTAATAAPYHRLRRDALAARFPGEWVIVPTGSL